MYRDIGSRVYTCRTYLLTLEYILILQHSNLNRKTCQNPKRQNDIHNQPRGPTRLKSRTLDSEINRNQTRNQEITREISEF